MTREKFVRLYLEPQGSTKAVRKPTKEELLAAYPDPGVDWHADRKTEQE
jgi:hypothetical protein